MTKGNHPHSEFKKGSIPWNKGKAGYKTGKRKSPMSDEHRAKLSLALKGREAPNKISDTHRLIGRRERVRFRKEMQHKVFERDGYCCVKCGDSGKIQVDHIKSWADYPELRFEITNCRTLCMACHYEITFKKKMPEGIVWGHNLNLKTGG